MLSYNVRDIDDVEKNIQKRCNYVAYWNMTPEERGNYHCGSLIDVED